MTNRRPDVEPQRVMRLRLVGAPGRRDRKAGVFEDEIKRLRAAGYTFEAIREALADVGVAVSNRTVQREAARRVRRPALVHQRPATSSQRTEAPPALAPSQAPVPAPPTGAPPGTGKEVAARFMAEFIASGGANPLLRSQARSLDETTTPLTHEPVGNSEPAAPPSDPVVRPDRGQGC